jgi:hypothetical protein
MPEYDREWNNLTRFRGSIHGDMDVDSSINNLRISFRWRPLINAALFKEMFQWTGDHVNAPDFILCGISNFFNQNCTE